MSSISESVPALEASPPIYICAPGGLHLTPTAMYHPPHHNPPTAPSPKHHAWPPHHAVALTHTPCIGRSPTYHVSPIHHGLTPQHALPPPPPTYHAPPWPLKVHISHRYILLVRSPLPDTASALSLSSDEQHPCWRGPRRHRSLPRWLVRWHRRQPSDRDFHLSKSGW